MKTLFTEAARRGLREAAIPRTVIYFSDEWWDVKKFIGKLHDVEQRAMVRVFREHGFNVKIKRGAKDPNTDDWSDDVLVKWDIASDAAMDLIEGYRKLKQHGPHGSFHDRIHSYVIEAFEASPKYGVGFGRGDPKQAWRAFTPEEQLYMIIDLGLANEDGSPTHDAVMRGAHIRS